MLPFNLDYFTDVMSLTHIQDFIDGGDMHLSLENPESGWKDNPEYNYRDTRDKVKNREFFK